MKIAIGENGKRLSERRGADDGDTALVEDGLLVVGGVEIESKEEVGAGLVEIDRQRQLVVPALFRRRRVHPLELHGAQLRPNIVRYHQATSARAFRAHQFHACNFYFIRTTSDCRWKFVVEAAVSRAHTPLPLHPDIP